MDLKGLLHGLSVRAPWLAAGRIILQRSGFTLHRGYEDTIGNALRETADPVRTAKLEELLREYAVAGEKLVRIVKLERGERTHLLNWIQGKRKTTHPLTDAFPGVVAEGQLRALKVVDPVSAGYLDLEAGHAAIFSSVRSYLDKVVIAPSKLRPGEADGFEKIFAMKRTYVQTYDSVWLPSTGDYACLMADLPDGTPSGFAGESQTYLEHQLRRQLGRALIFCNMWPAVDGLYQARQGVLTEYGFINSKDAVKHHTSRRGGKSLWDDVYDQAGAAAVGDDLQLFKIAVSWQRAGEKSSKARPEVLLPGKAALIQMANARLEHAIFRSCLNSGDLEDVMSRLTPHLK